MQEDIKQLLEDANNVGGKKIFNILCIILTDLFSDLDDLVLYFINTTSFYDSTDGTFPAELAIAKFSLKQGIIDDIQIRINPGKLPKGAPDTALKNAEKHKYDLPTDNDVEPDYMVILETMIKFLHPMDKLPIFFTEGNMRDKKIELEETRRVVAKIFYESEEDGMEVKIYPIDELFFTLQKITTANKNRLNETKNPPFSSIAFAADKFNKFNDFFYSSRGCDFHREKDAEPECCLSIVRRYGYTIAKWCSDGNRYELHEGKHFPEGYKHEDWMMLSIFIHNFFIIKERFNNF